VVCEFIKLIQVTPVYRFGGGVLIELDFLIVYFFSHIV
jgi:hypothetical protein